MAVDEGSTSRDGPLVLHGWLEPPVVAVALVVMATGFGQFGAIAALADVAAEFGAVADGADLTIAEQAGLSGTQLGVGLAAIRLASLGSLPLSGLADRYGRRKVLVGFGALGLLLVAGASLSPTYWWFVVIFSLSRPLLTATNAVGLVSAAEQTSSRDRASAIALVTAAYGVGAGLIAVIRGLSGDALGFRALFALALAPCVLVVVFGHLVTEPSRYRIAEARSERPLPVLGAIDRRYRPRLVPLLLVVAAVAAITGPANSFLFVYAESILELDPIVTAGLVVAAGVTGLAGLAIGRWGADRVGRRATGAFGLAGIAAAGIVTYSGSTAALAIGYLLAVLSGSAFAPAVGALQSELFPTEVRSSVAGWLVAAGVLGAVAGLLAFGAVADAGNRFALAAVVVFVPAALAGALLALVPETRGRELEETSGA